MEFLFGTTDYDEGARLIREKYQIPLVLITLGKDGSRAYYKDLRVEVPGFVQEHTIETTGAGDTFCANSLNYILEHGMEGLTEENLKELLTFANAAASLITTRKRGHFGLCRPEKKSRTLSRMYKKGICCKTEE